MGGLIYTLYANVPNRRIKKILFLIVLLVVLFGAVVVFKGQTGGSNVLHYTLESYVPVKSLAQLETEHSQRRHLVGQVCSMLHESEKPINLSERKDMLEHIIVDDKHQLLYCYVPKVACTNWKRVLMVAMGKSNTSNPQDIVPDDAHRQHVFRRLSNYSSAEIEYRVHHYMKFMFVRHPFERLLSAYRNKFYQNYTSSEYFRSRYGKFIIRNYRLNASEESLIRGHDVTFPEFVQYLLDPHTTQQVPFNEHWRPILELCHPCQISYDVIGKYETLDDDAWLVLQKSRLSHVVSFPKIERPSETPSLISQYVDSLGRDQVLQLYHLFEADFRLFDYQHQGID